MSGMNDSRRRAILVALLACAMLCCGSGGVRPAEASEFAAAGDLGIPGLSGSMTIYTESGYTRYLSEPKVLEVDPTGPAANLVFPDDVIVAIDDRLITSEEGSRLFSHPPIDRPVTLTIRRNGREKRIALTAREGVRPRSVGVDRVRRKVEEAISSSILGTGHPTWWLGFGIRCSINGDLEPVDSEGRAAWQFTTTPKVISVDPGSPADRSDLKVGDLILRIDGVSIDTPEATERIAAIEPNDVIEWTVKRWFTTHTVSMTAETRSPFARVEEDDRWGDHMAPVAVGSRTVFGASADDLKFRGELGDVSIEVRGPHRVETSVDESLDVIQIVVGETVIVLRAAPAAR